jgi:hypothetical protein
MDFRAEADKCNAFYVAQSSAIFKVAHAHTRTYIHSQQGRVHKSCFYWPNGDGFY